MAEPPKITALHRKAGARPGPVATPRGMTPEKALRHALAHASDGYDGLMLSVSEAEAVKIDQYDLVGELPELALFVLLDGPGESRGLLCLGPSLVDALIEVQTMRRVDSVARTPRMTTRIDAALTRDFVDAVIHEFTLRSAEMPEARWARGFHYGTYVPEAQPLGLMLEEGDYRLQRAKVEIGGGAKSSNVWLALPANASGGGKATGSSSGAASTSETRRTKPDPVWAKALETTVQAAPVRMEAVLARLSIPLSQIEDFSVGDMLQIPRRSIAEVKLETVVGAKGVRGRLGQQNGMRAVRLDFSDGPVSVPPPMAQSGPSTTAAALPPLPSGGVPNPPPSQPPPPNPPQAAPPDLPPPSDLPDMPDLPDLPPLEGGDLPPLPDLPPLSDLPDLPDLPPLPDP